MYLQDRKLFQKEINDFEKNGFHFRRNEEKKKFICENRNGAVDRGPFNIKRITNGTDSFLKGTLTTLDFTYHLGD